MIGQGSPIRAWGIAAFIAMATWAVSCASAARAEEVEIRLRIAWGGGPQAPQTWSGTITAPGATLSAMRPLGIEADEAAAVRFADNQVIVNPMVPRTFDGCDVSIRGDSARMVTVSLKSASAAEAKEVAVPLGDLVEAPLQARLDDLGGYVIIQRAPGDDLRVTIDRDHLVFGPSEPFKITVAPQLPAGTTGPLTLVTQLQSAAGGRVLWGSTVAYDAAAPAPVDLEIPTPAAEGAYRVSFSLRTHEGFASKLTPWQQRGPVASRDVEFVVIDPAARLPRITDKWETVQTIDPANPKWWQRVPEWTQLDRLPVLMTPRSLGNVKPVPRQSPNGSYVELSPPTAGADPSWQAYPLAIREIGQPHVVEIELPRGAPQQLAVSIVEPDAAGRVMSFGREAGVYVDRQIDSSANQLEGVERHRIVFWPRTATPLLLLANQSSEHAAAYGTIRVGRRETVAGEAVGAATAAAEAAADDDSVMHGSDPTGDRLMAAYVSLPQFCDSLGGGEELDAMSNLSVKGWGAFLEGASRLAQELRAGGYNAAVVSIAAGGSSLTPIDALGASPRFDTGPLSSRGADPLPKDVLEALLRVFDREGLRVIPAVDLATPLPELESLRRQSDSRVTGVECVTLDGRTWDDRFPAQAAGAHYNLLNADVQAAIDRAIGSLVDRYGAHASLSGVAVQLSGRGYGVLPGFAWGLDDATVARFARDADCDMPSAGANRFQQRSQLLAGELRESWITWRQAELTRFYARLAERVRAGASQRQLVLCTENIFAGAEATQRLRQAVSGRATLDEAAAELGVDFVALASTPGVCALRPRRLASNESLQARAADLLINSSTDFERVEVAGGQRGELHFYEARRLRLPSFDAQSPFGAEKTNVAMSMASYATGAAARRPLAAALASRDVFAVVEGGELLPLTLDAEATRLRRLFQELPGVEAKVRVQHRQPVTLRVYRTVKATTVCVVNDSSWEATLDLPLDASAVTAWRELGTDVAGEDAGGAIIATGSQAAGSGVWRVTLPPYGIAARRFASPTLKVGALAPSSPAAARVDLAASIDQIKQRMHSLDVERPYPLLPNPTFELGSSDNRMLGWQPRIGKSGSVEIVAARGATSQEPGVTPVGDMGRALHLRSLDPLGVAAQSTMFPIPATGQLTVRARVRMDKQATDARMYVWIECDALGAGTDPMYVPLEGELGESWSTCEVEFDELPMNSGGQMKVQFHLVGRGEAWVDDVELFDLRFADSQRKEIAKRLLAAQAALDEGQLADCQRLVEGYWPRFLVEYLPAPGVAPVGPTQPEVRIATLPDDGSIPPTDAVSPGLGDRVRHIFQR